MVVRNVAQAVAALQAAELVGDMDELATHVGLTSLEMFGLAVVGMPWDTKADPASGEVIH
ncbi:hypothetical protein ACFXNW_27310 [Nocardia sp. NPDC059180]|uniref:hypothetical protein n=1 Tax=Nocardia sp. NPDC059180 TaxID=3346761 RepID=UPI0036AB9BBE